MIQQPRAINKQGKFVPEVDAPHGGGIPSARETVAEFEAKPTPLTADVRSAALTDFWRW